jgi:hypothetical protein
MMAVRRPNINTLLPRPASTPIFNYKRARRRTRRMASRGVCSGQMWYSVVDLMMCCLCFAMFTTGTEAAEKKVSEAAVKCEEIKIGELIV